MHHLSDLITIGPRYARSVNLERDGFTDAAVEGYVVNATAEEFLRRFGRALAGAGGHRAWTLTGPYGAGKSSFAIFLANLFSPLAFGGASAARRLLREQHAETYGELFAAQSKGGLGKGGHVLIFSHHYPFALAKVKGPYNYIRNPVPELGVWFRHFRRVTAVRYYGDFRTNASLWKPLIMTATLTPLRNSESGSQQLVDEWLAAVPEELL